MKLEVSLVDVFVVVVGVSSVDVVVVLVVVLVLLVIKMILLVGMFLVSFELEYNLVDVNLNNFYVVKVNLVDGECIYEMLL